MLCLSLCQCGNQLGFFLTLNFKAVSSLSRSLVQVNNETSLVLKKQIKPKSPTPSLIFLSSWMSQLITGASHSKRNKESRFYYCDDASCFQLQQSNPHLPAFKFWSQSCHPVPVVSLASLLQFSFFSPFCLPLVPSSHFPISLPLACSEPQLPEC